MFEVHPNPQALTPDQVAGIVADPGFGAHYTDHMAIASWSVDDGWHDHRITALSDFRLHPSVGGLHYGQEIFEGLRAYRHPDGTIALFRPEKNAQRFARSAARLTMPPLPEQDFLAGVEALVSTDRAWVPGGENNYSLYLRPFQFASEAFIGVRESYRYTFAVIATPVGPYYAHPMKLWVTPTYARAAAGGTGAAKCGGNYAGSLIAAKEAEQHGCGQVMWLDAAEHTWVEECGTMNILFITADELLTPPAGGTILDGVTRDSLLKIAPQHGLTPVERPIAATEVFEGVATGRIREVLACGTAAVVTPITGFRTPGEEGNVDHPVGDQEAGPTTLELRQHLLDVQFGRREDTHGWIRPVA